MRAEGDSFQIGARELDPQRLGDHIDRLYRAAWGLCGSREDAEDLVQETYAKVLARPRLLRREDDLGYLLRALRNTFPAGRPPPSPPPGRPPPASPRGRSPSRSTRSSTPAAHPVWPVRRRPPSRPAST